MHEGDPYIGISLLCMKVTRQGIPTLFSNPSIMAAVNKMPKTTTAVTCSWSNLGLVIEGFQCWRNPVLSSARLIDFDDAR